MARWLLIVTVLLTLAAGGAGLWINHAMNESMNAPLPLARAQLFRVEAGDNINTVARRMEAQGWLVDFRLLALRARIDGVARSIKAGTYEFEPGATLTTVLDDLVNGRVKVFTLTFVEGCTFAEMRRQLANTSNLTHAADGLKEASVIRTLDIPQATAEGLFFPATYHYDDGTADLEILARAYRRMREVLDEAWNDRDDGLPYATPYEALTMASIIEKETGVAAERAEIAGVFVRRLQRGMKLQTDPTVIYGLGAAFNGNLTRADLRADTPYNTYTRAGLPPTPIAMPGLAAIEAALNPAPGKALYFVAKGDGTHQFSASLGEHNAAVRRYQLKR